MMRRFVPLLALAALCACDRNVEPYVPGEEPRQPDLSKIFPEGAEQAGPMTGPLELPPPPGQGQRGADAFASAEPIRGVIRLPDELAARAPTGGVLFLIARPGETGPPVAVKRFPRPSFPLRFAIGPDDRMIRSMPFAGDFVVSARLDADGDAASRDPGDLQGRAVGVHSPGATGVEVVLDELL